MLAEVILPDLQSTPIYLSLWFADAGERVFEGDRLVEVLVEGATFDVPAPATGRLVEKRAWHQERLHPGQILGLVETESPVGDASEP